MVRRALRAAWILAACAATSPAQRQAPTPGAYLFVWTGDSAMKAHDFLAVIDANPKSPHYGSVVTTLEVPAAGMPHHTEHVVADDNHLLASDFSLGRTWLFDVSNATHPRVLSTFDDRAGLSHPHSYFRLPGGNVIATFQYAGNIGPMTMEMGPASSHRPVVHRRTGGLVVMTERGKVLRTGSAFAPRADSMIYPYSVLALPSIDRAISTGTDMDESDTLATARWLQIWRLSDLELLHMVPLPPGPSHTEQNLAGEARLLPDGHSIYVHTFNCGLYLLDARTLDHPQPRFVRGFPGTNCGVPLVASHYWLQPVPGLHALLALDVSDPAHPREVSRATFDSTEFPHWIAIDPSGRRVVLDSGLGGHRLFIVDFDPASGVLAIDRRFHDAGSTTPGVLFDQRQWPQGKLTRAVPHGAVFSR